MREGWIDWALLDLQPAEKPVEEAVEGGVYAESQEGGRVQPDGDELRWRVTFPNVEHGRGGVPFFCKDLTPRKRRVPIDIAANLKHACGATGVATIKLVAIQAAIDQLAEQFDVVLGIQGRKVSISPPTYTWEAEVPVFEKAKPPSVTLKAATSQEETEWAQGLGTAAVAGIWQIELITSRPASSLSVEGETTLVQGVKLGFVEEVQA